MFCRIGRLSRAVLALISFLLLMSALSVAPSVGGGREFGPGALSPWGDKAMTKHGFGLCAVIVKVIGLDPPKGILRVALYDSKESYDKRTDPIRSAAVEIDSSNATVEFADLYPGQYAIMMYHDTNKNNKFDRFLGLPREQYGFSNNVLPGLGPPDFDAVRFTVEAGKVTFVRIQAR